MNHEKMTAIRAVEEKVHLVREAAEKIWGFAELSLQEEQSAEVLCRLCEEEGFAVTRGVCNIPTAFTAVYGA